MTTELTNENPFHIVKLFLNKASTKNEIMKKLNIKAPTFHKYIHMLKSVGFEIIRKKGNYQIRNYKNLIKLSSHETSLLAYLSFLSFYMLPYTKFTNFLTVVEKALCLCNKNNYKETFSKFNSYKIYSMNDDFRDKINAIQSHIDRKSTMEITLASKRKLSLTPLGFEWGKDRVYLYYLDSTKMKKGTMLLENIVKISKKGEKDPDRYANETIFELYGRLAKSYLLKENERIVDSNKEKIVVANSTNDKNNLFKRLLRYDVLCKVIFPKNDVIEFENLIKKSLDNISQFQDNIN